MPKKITLGELGCEKCKFWNLGVCRIAQSEFIPKDECPGYAPIDLEERGLKSEPLKLPEGAVREEAVAKGIGRTYTYTGDVGFDGRIQIVAVGFPRSRFTRLILSCRTDEDENCASCPFSCQSHISLEDNSFDPSAFATYFDTNNPHDALRVVVEKGLKPACSRWSKRVYVQGQGERAVTKCSIVDREGTQGRGWFIHGERCDLSRAPNWVVAKGWLCRGKGGQIGVFVMEFKTQSEIEAPSKKDVEEARQLLARQVGSDTNLESSGPWIIARSLKRRSGLKGDEIIRGFVSDLLTIASPTWVKTPEGPEQLGATTCELGPTTAAKSLRERLLIDMIGAGTYDTGRKTEAGVTAGVEKVEGIGWVVKKGLLPSSDLSFLVVDNMPEHQLDSQIEARRDGVVSISAIKSAKLWARCRLKLLSNPRRPFDELMYKCAALKVYDSKLIARFTFAIFTYGVSTEERYNPANEEPSAEDDGFVQAARTLIRWNLSREVTYKPNNELWQKILKRGQELEETYGCEDLPLYLRANPYKLTILAYSFALLEGAEEPNERHVDLAFMWLDQCGRDIELDQYVDYWQSQHQLSEVDYEKLDEAIKVELGKETETYGSDVPSLPLFKLVEYVARNERGQRDEIAAYAECDSKTVSRKANILKGLRLLKSDRDGYHFTPRGVRFFKRWLQGGVPEVPQVPDSEAHTPSEGGEGGRNRWKKQGVGAESGDFKDLRDRGQQRLGEVEVLEVNCQVCEHKYGRQRRATRAVKDARGLPLYLCRECYQGGEF